MNIALTQPECSQPLSETSRESFQLLVPEAVQPGRGCLLQIYPARPSAEIIRLQHPRTVIGRDLCCHVVLDDRSASRTHAVIDADELGYVLTDLGSTNGTWIDDQPIQTSHRLRGGALVRMGGTILKFMSAIDEEARYHAAVHELITRDPLTNAFNRAFLLPMLDKMLVNCRTLQTELSVILLDIDFFKAINDQHGHLAGDEILRLFCERIRGCLRPSDLLARFGGEEFVVIAAQSRRQDSVRIAERLRLAVASTPFTTQAGPLQVTCSLGVAWTDGDVLSTVDHLLGEADQRLYQAKQSGRNVVCGPHENAD